MKTLDEYRAGSVAKQTVNWQHLYVISEKWQSDMSFYADEINFFRNILTKNILPLLDHFERTRKVTAALVALDKLQVGLSQKVHRHVHHLSDHFSSPFVLADPAYIDEHQLLEDEMAEFMIKFRAVKKTIFRYMDEILKSERNHHLIVNT